MSRGVERTGSGWAVRPIGRAGAGGAAGSFACHTAAAAAAATGPGVTVPRPLLRKRLAPHGPGCMAQRIGGRSGQAEAQVRPDQPNPDPGRRITDRHDGEALGWHRATALLWRHEGLGQGPGRCRSRSRRTGFDPSIIISSPAAAVLAAVAAGRRCRVVLTEPPHTGLAPRLPPRRHRRGWEWKPYRRRYARYALRS